MFPYRLQVYCMSIGFIMMSPLFKPILKFCTTNHLFTCIVYFLVAFVGQGILNFQLYLIFYNTDTQFFENKMANKKTINIFLL